MKDKIIKNISVYKERDYNGILGELQFWEESDENLVGSMSTGNMWDWTHRVQGLHLGQLRFSKDVTPKMAKKIAKIIKEALGNIENPKIKTSFIPN